jgi:hypothetical protein
MLARLTLPRRIDLVWFLGLVTLGCAVTIVWGERIGIHNGEGWDGTSYTAWARDFPAMLDKGVTRFQAMRILPSAIVYATTTLLGHDHANHHVLPAFQILNGLALVVSAGLLYRIAITLAWSRAQAWAGFACTFLGFHAARYALYYPAETDALGFLWAMAATWGYVERRPIALWLALVGTALTWPALLAFGFVALILPRAREPIPALFAPWLRKAALATALATAAFIVGWFVYSLTYPVAPGGWSGARSFSVHSNRDLWPVSIALVVLPSALAAYYVARDPRTFAIKPYLLAVGWKRLVLGLAGVLAIVGLSWWWRDQLGTQGPGFTWRDLANYYAHNGVRGPLWSITHQVVYFGPVILLALVAWPRIATLAASWGPGAVLGLGLIVVTCTQADGRHLLHLSPFLVVITISATRWNWQRALAVAIVGLGWSKVWWKIGYEQVHKSREWPDLRWFMHHGPWAADDTFAWHFAAAIVSALVLVLVFRRFPA